MTALKDETIYADCIDCGKPFKFIRKHHHHARDRCKKCYKAAYRRFDIGSEKKKTT